ncbi:MAG: hypothetical protein AAFU72_04980 [Pseudomonadota bacterium]
MAETSSATAAETAAETPDLADPPATGDTAPALPEGLTVEESADETRLAIAADLKVADAVEMREALLAAIQTAAAAGRRVIVVSEAEGVDGVVGVPALQLAIAGSRHAESLTLKTKGGGRRQRRASTSTRASKTKKATSVAGANKAVAS